MRLRLYKELMRTAFIIILILTLILTGCTGGNENDSQPVYTGPAISDNLSGDWHKTTISKVESMMGDSLPIPAYIPTNYEIKEIYYRVAGREPPGKDIVLLMSDQDVGWTGSTFTCRVVLLIEWNCPGLGLKMPWARYISEVNGGLEEREGEYALWWEISRPNPLGSTLILRARQ